MEEEEYKTEDIEFKKRVRLSVSSLDSLHFLLFLDLLEKKKVE